MILFIDPHQKVLVVIVVNTSMPNKKYWLTIDDRKLETIVLKPALSGVT